MEESRFRIIIVFIGTIPESSREGIFPAGVIP
jgi:hypothetical protein